MNLIEKINEIIFLTESYFHTVKIPRTGDIIEIFKNPSSSEYNQVLKSMSPERASPRSGKQQFIRGVIKGKDIYIWRGDGMHSEVGIDRKLGLFDATLIVYSEGIYIYTEVKQMSTKSAKAIGDKIRKFAINIKGKPIFVDDMELSDPQRNIKSKK